MGRYSAAIGRRVAIMRVSGELLRALLPPGKVIDLQADTIQRAKDFEWLRQVLLLPDNCRVDDVSPHCYFATDEYALRLECEDFVETAVGDRMPEVRAEYVRGPDGTSQRSACKGRFSHWVGGVREGYKLEAPAEPVDGPSVLGKVYETFNTADEIDEARRVRFREWL
jgi:hypothetical protein